jgi:hypothetical protein
LRKSDGAHWKSRLFEAKKEWVQEYFHYKEHPNDAAARQAFGGKYNAWLDIANEGIRKARAYLKEHPQS